MLESLDINGRTYVPADGAALEVGYPTSYIERLALGKWIDASFVQGQCFVDIASLMEFIAATENDTCRQMLEEAKREKIDALLEAYETRLEELPQPSSTWLIVGQLGVVTTCGLLVGLLSFTAVDAQLTWREFSTGISQTASVIRERVSLPASVFEAIDSSAIQKVRPRATNSAW